MLNVSSRITTHLCSTVQLRRVNSLIVDLLQRTKVDVGRRKSVHFTGFKDDTRSRGICNLASLPQQRVKLVDGKEMTEGVDRHVTIDAGSSKSTKIGKEDKGKILLGTVSKDVIACLN